MRGTTGGVALLTHVSLSFRVQVATSAAKSGRARVLPYLEVAQSQLQDLAGEGKQYCVRLSTATSLLFSPDFKAGP